MNRPRWQSLGGVAIARDRAKAAQAALEEIERTSPRPWLLIYDDTSALRDIEVGTLPLALEQARSFCWATNCTFDEYLRRLNRFLHETPHDPEYSRPAQATITLAIKRALDKSPAVDTLVGVFAFLAPDRIPLDLIPSDLVAADELDQVIAALPRDVPDQP